MQTPEETDTASPNGRIADGETEALGRGTSRFPYEPGNMSSPMSGNASMGFGRAPGAGAPLVDVGPSSPSKGALSFASSVLALGGGAALAQVIATLCAPITARLFAPEAFGLAAIFGSLVSLYAITSCLGYQVTIQLPADDRDAANLIGLCGVITTASSLVSLFVILLFGQAVVGALNAEALGPYLWLFPVAVFIYGAALPLQYWNSRHRRFSNLAAVRVTSGLSDGAAQIGTGLAGLTSGGSLLVAKLLAPAVSAVMLGWYALRTDLPFILRQCTVAGMWRTGRRYVKFPIFSSFSALLNTASFQAPTLLLAAFFGATVTGLYSRAFILVAMPMGIVAQAISQVFFQRAAARQAAGESLTALVEGICQRLTGFVLLPMLMLALIGPDVFALVFGARWEEAGTFAAILVPWTLAMLLTASVTELFVILERQGTDLLFNILFLTTRVGALVAGGALLRDARLTLLLFSIVSALGYILRAHYLLAFAGMTLGRLASSLRLNGLLAVPPLVITAGASWGMGLSPAWVLVTAVVTATPGHIYLLWNDPYARQVLARVARKAGLSQ